MQLLTYLGAIHRYILTIVFVIVARCIFKILIFSTHLLSVIVLIIFMQYTFIILTKKKTLLSPQSAHIYNILSTKMKLPRCCNGLDVIEDKDAWKSWLVASSPSCQLQCFLSDLFLMQLIPPDQFHYCYK